MVEQRTRSELLPAERMAVEMSQAAKALGIPIQGEKCEEYSEQIMGLLGRLRGVPRGEARQAILREAGITSLRELGLDGVGKTYACVVFSNAQAGSGEGLGGEGRYDFPPHRISFVRTNNDRQPTVRNFVSIDERRLAEVPVGTAKLNFDNFNGQGLRLAREIPVNGEVVLGGTFTIFERTSSPLVK